MAVTKRYRARLVATHLFQHFQSVAVAAPIQSSARKRTALSNAAPMPATMPVTSTRYAFKYNGLDNGRPRGTAKLISLSAAGPLLVGPDHILAILLPEADSTSLRTHPP